MKRETVSTVLLILAAGASSPAAIPQERSAEAHFAGEERVTAVDVVVDFDHDRLRRGKSGRGAPEDLSAKDFQVLYDGEPRPVVAVEPKAEPWTLVVYLDPVLTSSYGLAWAADVLARHAADLVRLGDVEVVVADPAPRTQVAATREAGDLEGYLSQVALRLPASVPSSGAPAGTGRTELLAMRAEFLGEALHPTPAVDPQEFARWVVAEEVRMGRLWQDRLLDFLVERAGDRPRRAVILVSSGFDLRPGSFYLPAVDLGAEAHAPSTPSLVEDVDALSRVLGAYGWTVIPLIPPDPEPEVRRGKRIGKWRLQPGSSLATPAGAALESERDAGKAEAYLELGLALAGQGKDEDAEDAFKKALHHFFGDPRTAGRQALALLELGAVREKLGKAELAERDYAAARELDPAEATARLGPEVEMLDPAAPLRFLAEATTGIVARDAERLAKAVENLGRRVRLTYQVAGAATGGLHPVAVIHGPTDEDLAAPRWARSGTPAAVAAARARRLLAGDVLDGELEVRALFEPSERKGSGNLTVTVSGGPPFEAGKEALLRVTWATGAPDVPGRAASSDPVALDGGMADWSRRLAVTLGPEDSLVAVVVEDLYSGFRGTTILAVEDPDNPR